MKARWIIGWSAALCSLGISACSVVKENGDSKTEVVYKASEEVQEQVYEVVISLTDQENSIANAVELLHAYGAWQLETRGRENADPSLATVRAFIKVGTITQTEQIKEALLKVSGVREVELKRALELEQKTDPLQAGREEGDTIFFSCL